MRAALALLSNLTLLRYVGASVVALVADVGSFSALLALGTAPAAAAAIGYGLGVAVHWLVSSRAVFADSVAARGPERTRQKAMFLISALLGLALTTLIVGAGTRLGAEPHLSKGAAVIASFTLTWLLRSRIVFAGSAAA